MTALVPENILSLVRDIFREQPFLLKKDKDIFCIDLVWSIKNFRSFEIANSENDYAQCQNAINALSQEKSENAQKIVHILKGHLMASKVAKDGDLKKYYDELSQIFGIKNQTVILNIRHYISIFELGREKFALLSLVTDNFVNANAILKI